MGFWNTLGKITGAISGVGPLLELGGSVVNAISGSNAQKKANETNMAIANQNNQTAIDIANKNNQAAIDLQRENNEFNRQQAIDMFNMEANYNSPEQQVARLREAGINPSAFYAGQGQVSTGNENASAPQAASAGVSFQQPNLTTPQVSAIPSIAGGFIGALEQLARIKNIKSNTSKQDAETQEITTLLGEKLQQLITSNEGQELANAYQEFENIMQPLYADQRLKRGAQEIANLVADYNNALATHDNINADTAKKQIETRLAKTQNRLLKKQTPLILANLEKQGQLIVAQTKTEGTKQAANIAAASASYASAALNNAKAKTENEAREDYLRFQKANADTQEAIAKSEGAHATVAESTVTAKIEEAINLAGITAEQKNELKERVRRAKKENDWYEVHQVQSILNDVSNQVRSWVIPYSSNVQTTMDSSSSNESSDFDFKKGHKEKSQSSNNSHTTSSQLKLPWQK